METYNRQPRGNQTRMLNKAVPYFRCLLAISVLLPTLLMGATAHAMDEPDTPPTIEDIHCFQNVLEPGDLVIIILEKTPYATIPDIDYSDAFIWRLIDTDNATELGQAVGYDFNECGYGFNVISFYFAAEDAPAWEGSLGLILSGTPSAFVSPPSYGFTLAGSSWSDLVDTAAVKSAISVLVLNMAADLDVKWGLEVNYSLLGEYETGRFLSVFGQAFFRGAIYGVQAMAPDAFYLKVSDVNVTSREWDPEYVTDLVNQYEGTYIAPALVAGEEFFDVEYNLMGMLIVLGICVVLVFSNWYLSGGNLWKGAVEMAAPLVIGSRLALFGLGEVALIAALCWLYLCAKLWKII